MKSYNLFRFLFGDFTALCAMALLPMSVLKYTGDVVRGFFWTIDYEADSVTYHVFGSNIILTGEEIYLRFFFAVAVLGFMAAFFALVSHNRYKKLKRLR